MFENIFKKLYKSRKSISKEEKQKLEKEANTLNEEIDKRKLQIEKFNFLISNDSKNQQRYKQRIEVHTKLISESETRVKQIEIILLDS